MQSVKACSLAFRRHFLLLEKVLTSASAGAHGTVRDSAGDGAAWGRTTGSTLGCDVGKKLSVESSRGHRRHLCGHESALRKLAVVTWDRQVSPVVSSQLSAVASKALHCAVSVSPGPRPLFGAAWGALTRQGALGRSGPSIGAPRAPA